MFCKKVENLAQTFAVKAQQSRYCTTAGLVSETAQWINRIHYETNCCIAFVVLIVSRWLNSTLIQLFTT